MSSINFTDKADQAKPYVLALFRIVTSVLFASHGAASIWGILGGNPFLHGAKVPTGQWPYWYAAVIELVGGSLIALGLFTRIAALICSGTMAYAYFTVHLPIALWPLQNYGEPSAFYAWAFLLIATFGPGALALRGDRAVLREERV